MPISALTPRLGLAGLGVAATVGAGVALARDVQRFERGEYTVSQGGSASGGVTAMFMSIRNVVARGLAHWAQPAAVWTIARAEHDARTTEHRLFQGGRNKNGYDNGADAFRHAYGSALMAFRLERDRDMSPSEAAAMMRDFGMAHEQDSFLTGLHHGYSRDMDLHNNEAGLAVGQRLAADPQATEADVSEAVLNAIRGGAAVVLDSTTTPPRASRASDLDLPQRDAPVGREPSGIPSFTQR